MQSQELKKNKQILPQVSQVSNGFTLEELVWIATSVRPTVQWKYLKI